MNDIHINQLSKKSLHKIETTSKMDHHFKIQFPEEVGMGNWASKIMFINNQNRIVYYNMQKWAHNISTKENHISFLNWNSTGNICRFYEFERGVTYDLCLICFHTMTKYNLSLISINDSKNLFSKDIDTILEEFDFVQTNLRTEPIQDYVDNKSQWFPASC